MSTEIRKERRYCVFTLGCQHFHLDQEFTHKLQEYEINILGEYIHVYLHFLTRVMTVMHDH